MQRKEINKQKELIAAVKEMNVRFKREININAGTEEEYTKRAVMQA